MTSAWPRYVEGFSHDPLLLLPHFWPAVTSMAATWPLNSTLVTWPEDTLCVCGWPASGGVTVSPPPTRNCPSTLTRATLATRWWRTPSSPWRRWPGTSTTWRGNRSTQCDCRWAWPPAAGLPATWSTRVGLSQLHTVCVLTPCTEVRCLRLLMSSHCASVLSRLVSKGGGANAHLTPS